MQGNWSINVKAKNAAFAQQFIVTGAASGNGTYSGTVGSPTVHVTGNQWTIAILNNPGSGFQLSDTRIKFPSIVSGNYVFDIQSNDAGADQDFDDLILTCSRPANVDNFMIYGNVTLYSGHCYFNPCRRRWIIIDTHLNLLKALENPKLKKVIEKLYPGRIPPVIINPNPPDPPPDFIPMMINITDEIQLPDKQAALYRRMENQNLKSKSKEDNTGDDMLLSNYSFERTASLTSVSKSAVYHYDKVELGLFVEPSRLLCYNEPGSNLTLAFEEYDRSASELAGGPYTGSGNRTALGNAITDSNGNYIFLFTQTPGEFLDEIFNDTGAGENIFVQMLPDIIVKVNQASPVFANVFESAPYFNIGHLKRVDICLPKEKVHPTSLCFNGNLIGEIGNVFIGGNQNINAHTTSAALDRNGYNNHLRPNGKITVHNSQAGFRAECACWVGNVDVKGCMYNARRNNADPIITHYTIRYKKPGDLTWGFVNESYLHPKFSKRNLPNYNGDLVGPFTVNLKVDGGPAKSVPAYMNIQAQVFYNGIDWEWTNLDRYMQLTTAIYQDVGPGTVYFLVEGYDSAGNLVSGARDLIAMFIDNVPLGFSLDNVWFADDGINVIKAECNLYKMKDTALNTPLNILFKANDKFGFLDHYDLGISKCGTTFGIAESIPGISSGSNPSNTDSNSCPGYKGTSELSKFGDNNSHAITYTPSAAEGGWLKADVGYSLFYVGLSAAKRQTNGYNSGLDSSSYSVAFTFAIQKI